MTRPGRGKIKVNQGILKRVESFLLSVECFSKRLRRLGGAFRQLPSGAVFLSSLLVLLVTKLNLVTPMSWKLSFPGDRVRDGVSRGCWLKDEAKLRRQVCSQVQIGNKEQGARQATRSMDMEHTAQEAWAGLPYLRFGAFRKRPVCQSPFTGLRRRECRFD